MDYCSFFSQVERRCFVLPVGSVLHVILIMALGKDGSDLNFYICNSYAKEEKQCLPLTFLRVF